MRILFVSQWYAPEPDGRVSALAEGLVQLGHDVCVVTGFPNYPQGKIYPGYKIKWRQRENLNGVKVLRLPLYPDHSQSVIKRVLNYASFSMSLFFLSPWMIKKPDVIWSYTPFMALPTIWLHKIFRAPYVMEIADIWPDTIISTGMMKQGPLIKLMASLAKVAYKNAAAITVQNIGFKPCLVERGASAEKIVVIENWADDKLYRPVDYDSKLAHDEGLSDKFNVMFAGNMGLAQGLDNIVSAAKRCIDNNRIQFVFIGDGGCLSQIKERVATESLSNVVFIARKPASAMPAYFAIADILLVNLRDDPIFEITMPGKTQSYLACGRPIIIAKRGVDAKLLADQGCALNCEPDNSEALAGLIDKVFHMPPEERSKMGQLGLKVFNERYKKDILLRKMETVLAEVAQC